jgi:primosomal protein N' (replication factor Y)
MGSGAAQRWIHTHRAGAAAGGIRGVGSRREPLRDSPRNAAPRVLIAGRGQRPGARWPGRSRPPAVGCLACGQECPGRWAGARAGPAPGLPPSAVLPGMPCPGSVPAVPRADGDPGAPGRRPDAVGVQATSGPRGSSARTVKAPRCDPSTVGARRTAEELGRAFPGVPLGDLWRRRRHGHRAGSPGPRRGNARSAEPIGRRRLYVRRCCLDAWALLERADLDAGLETLRRWCAAAALVRPADAGGVVVVAGVPAWQSPRRPVEALGALGSRLAGRA